MFYLRQTHPKFVNKVILLCEDVLHNQIAILSRLNSIVPEDGSVEVITVPSCIAAANLINTTKINLIILDHDMTLGNGTDLLKWMKKEGKEIPIITASGIPQNNTNMMALGAKYCFSKQEVIDGKADEIIKNYIKE